MKRAIFPGTFDPITNGHTYVVYKGLEIFDEIVFAIAKNPIKVPTFSKEERLEMLVEISKPLGKRVLAAVLEEGEALVDFAKQTESQFIIRGVRNADDFKTEQEWMNLNLKMNPHITLVTIIPPDEYIRISSSSVKELTRIGKEKYVRNMVPLPVYYALLRKYNININPGEPKQL